MEFLQSGKFIYRLRFKAFHVIYMRKRVLEVKSAASHWQHFSYKRQLWWIIRGYCVVQFSLLQSYIIIHCRWYSDAWALDKLPCHQTASYAALLPLGGLWPPSSRIMLFDLVVTAPTYIYTESKTAQQSGHLATVPEGCPHIEKRAETTMDLGDFCQMLCF